MEQSGQLKRDSILRMAQGAIEEKVDYEVTRVIDNILEYFANRFSSEIDAGLVVVVV